LAKQRRKLIVGFGTTSRGFPDQDRTMKKNIALLATLTAIFTGCATQQDVITLDSRTVSLERKYNDLQQKYAAMEAQLDTVGQSRTQKEQNLRDQSATIRAEVRRIREDLQELKGRIEESDYQAQHMFSGLDRRLDAQEKRLAKMEAYLDVRGGAEGRSSASKPISGSPKFSEDVALYTRGKEAFDREDFDGARAAFSDLLKKYPKSDQADNAQFWIGETYYRQSWYEKAILEYQKVIELYPQGNKVPAALLKQGLAFTALGDNDNAKLIFKELIDRYPQSTEAKAAAQKLKP
jgi:tol-pal system protein YbgF